MRYGDEHYEVGYEVTPIETGLDPYWRTFEPGQSRWYVQRAGVRCWCSEADVRACVTLLGEHAGVIDCRAVDALIDGPPA